MIDLKTFQAKMDDFFKEALEISQAGSFQKLAAVFSTYEGRLREEVQEMTRPDMNQIIRKLESEELITEEERGLIELWIVGDARHFLRLENKFKANVDELKTLREEIAGLCGQESAVETVAQLCAVLEYGARLNYALAFFLEKKERIDNFQKTISALGPDQRAHLIDILKSKSKYQENE